MNRSLPWGWIAFAGLVLLLPGPLGRLLLDLLGRLTLLLILLPLLAGAAGLIGWQLLRRRLKTCAACGFSSFGFDQCPACGAASPGSAAPGQQPLELDARSATITVEAVDVDAVDVQAVNRKPVDG
jgi:hypothetical protein